MAESAPVRGCMTIKPYGWAIWELMRDEMDANQATITRRDLGKDSRRTIAVSELIADAKGIMDTIQRDMYNAAAARNKTMIHDVANLAELDAALGNGTVGFFRIKYDQTTNQEFDEMMEKYKITRRCLDDNNPTYVFVAKSY